MHLPLKYVPGDTPEMLARRVWREHGAEGMKHLGRHNPHFRLWMHHKIQWEAGVKARLRQEARARLHGELF